MSIPAEPLVRALAAELGSGIGNATAAGGGSSSPRRRVQVQQRWLEIFRRLLALAPHLVLGGGLLEGALALMRGGAGGGGV